MKCFFKLHLKVVSFIEDFSDCDTKEKEMERMTLIAFDTLKETLIYTSN